MPLTEPIVGLFTDEWDRFTKATARLSEPERAEYKKAYAARQYEASGRTVISLPGWSETFRTSVPYTPTYEETREFYRAQRTGRRPDLPAFVLTELQRRDAVKERMARDPAPAYAQSFGAIATAIDNVQDFVSTVATFGRLSLWAGTRALQAALPGATAEFATAQATLAARQAAVTAGREFAQTVAQRAAAGNLVARLALNNPAVYRAALAEAQRFAAEAAYRTVFNRAFLGVAGRMAARFVPILGWVVLASDVLNILSFFAMMGTPLYALMCEGPRAALSAGVPAALFKGALKRETWRAHNLNPFSRKAVAARALKSAGRLPGFSNLVEVAQTTDSLFGMGLSLGGAVGLVNGVAFGAYEFSQGRTVEIQGWPDIARAVPQIQQGRPDVDPGLRKLLQQAGHVVTVSPAMFSVQEHFTEEEHVLAAMALHQAVALLRWYWKGSALPDLLPEVMARRWPAPLSVDAQTVLWAEATGRDLEAGRRWWFGNAPKEVSGEAYAEYHTRAVPEALRAFLLPRRSAPIGALYGALVNEATEGLWLIAEDDPDLFRWSLTTDARLLSDFVESGWLLPPGADEGAVWRLWQAARAELEATEASSLRPGRWAALAESAGVVLTPALPPQAAVPAEWLPASDVEAGGG